MHEQHQQQQKSFLQEAALTTNAVIGACQIVGMILYVFLRTPGSWGSRFAGFRMVFSWIFLYCFGPLFYPNEDLRPLALLFFASTVLLLLHRIAGVIRRARGYESHSLYPGNSWLGNTERDIVFLLFVSIALFGFNKPLAAYLLTATACWWVNEAWQHSAHAAKRRAMKDAQFEAEALMDY